MKGLVIYFVISASLAYSVSEEFQKLARCVEQKDRACVTACLKTDRTERSAEYFALAARGYMLLGQNQEAVKSISQAVEWKPDNFDYRMEQGWLYQRSGDQVSAIESFLHASQINPQSSSVFYELGMSFFFANEHERAMRHFKHALQLDPKNDKAEFMNGVVEIWLGHLEEAKLHFANALQFQPHNAHYLLHYGVLLAKLNENDLALKKMLEAEKLDGANPLTHYQIGKRYRLMGKLPEARQELETAVRLRPNLSPALYQLGETYHKLGQEARARAALERFEELSQREKTEKQDPIDASLEN